MSLRRAAILIRREMLQAPKSYLFITALGIPLMLSIVVPLVFGTFFAGLPRLGVVDTGSEVTWIVGGNEAIITTTYTSEETLLAAMEQGAVDVGLVIPAEFDAQVRTGAPAFLKAYVWGESTIRNRLVPMQALLAAVRTVAGHGAQVEVVHSIVGEGVSIPWEKRMLPLMVIVPVLFGGMMIPAASLVSEKSRRTLTALSVTPALAKEVLLAKATLGILVALFTGALVLALNQALGQRALLMLLVLFAGSLVSAMAGVLMGIHTKDINSLFATMKALGLFLYAPAIVRMFPEVPGWFARVFPTHYVLNPVVEISQNNASLGQVVPDLIVLALLGTALLLAISKSSSRLTES